METKHTKGEWIYCGGDSDSCAPFEIAGKIVVEVTRHCHNTGIEEMSREEMEANAKLLASAPELLEALQFVSDNFHNLESENQELYNEIFSRIQQAISKATGV